MSSKLITYKAVLHERIDDAPFVGALIVAPTCSNNCPSCFNQHLKNLQDFIQTSDYIIYEVCSNPFNEGIILGGLEWSERPDEAIDLIDTALQKGLQVILYTGLTKDALEERIPTRYLKGCYVKYGRYDKNSTVDNYYQYGVKLASSNQYIEYIE